MDDVGADPTTVCEIVNNGGTLKVRDQAGVFNVRTGRPVPYGLTSLSIPDGQYAVRVDPELSGSDSISIFGSGSLLVH